MSTTEGRNETTGDDTSDQSVAELQTQLELLAEENQQLRDSYARAKRTQYRRTALGLALVGLVAMVGAVLFPALRTILIALGSVGLFSAILTFYLTPEQFVSADVGRNLYATQAANESALVTELGLAETRLYVPVEGAENGVRLFVPQYEEYTIPNETELTQRLVVADDTAANGMALDPSGGRLFREAERVLSGPVADEPQQLSQQLTDVLIEQFELVGAAEPDVDVDEQRLTVGVSESVYGPVDRFDHPVVSLLATGLANGLKTPVTSEVTATEDSRADHLVTLRW